MPWTRGYVGQKNLPNAYKWIKAAQKKAVQTGCTLDKGVYWTREGREEEEEEEEKEEEEEEEVEQEILHLMPKAF
jgi:hypothetical protein